MSMNDVAALKRRRFLTYAVCSAAVLVVAIVIVAGRPGLAGYRPDRAPGLGDAIGYIVFWLVPTSLFGVFGFVGWRRATAAGRRWFLFAGAAVGFVGSWFMYHVAQVLSDLDCAPSDCVAAVPSDAFLRHAWWVALVPAVVLPLGLALVRWPSDDQTTSRSWRAATPTVTR